MNTNELIENWKSEERIAHIHGWDFSHIAGRYTEEDDLPWDYREVILWHLMPEMKILDIDTGGGEFLLSLGHPHGNTAATENHPPNVELCREALLPLGVDFRPADGCGVLPFDDGSFDMVINRHGDFNAGEIYRVLKPGGCSLPSRWGRRMTGSWWSFSAVKPSCPSRSSIWISPFGNSGTPDSGFWRRRSVSVPFGSSMWVRWSGLQGSSNGNFPDSRWTKTSIVC